MHNTFHNAPLTIHPIIITNNNCGIAAYTVGDFPGIFRTLNVMTCKPLIAPVIFSFDNVILSTENKT